MVLGLMSKESRVTAAEAVSVLDSLGGLNVSDEVRELLQHDAETLSDGVRVREAVGPVPDAEGDVDSTAVMPDGVLDAVTVGVVVTSCEALDGSSVSLSLFTCVPLNVTVSVREK
jgi:3-oxoacyl-ACP reductase-like protein